MITSQRLLIILIVINLLVGIGGAIYQEKNDINYEQLNNQTATLENYNIELGQEENSIAQQSQYQLQEGTFGNGLRMSAKIFYLFAAGLRPFPFEKDTFGTFIEQIIAAALVFLKGLMYALAGMELYMLIKNRKTS